MVVMTIVTALAETLWNSSILLFVEPQTLPFPASLQHKSITVICVWGLWPPGHPSVSDSKGS